MKNSLLPLFIIAGILILQACQNDLLVVECDGSAPTYDSEIVTIINSNCATTSSCHGSGANNNRGEFLSYEDLLDDINSGEFEKQVITKQKMPKNGELSQDQLTVIQCWIENGYPES